MAIQNFIVELMEELLKDKELGLTERDLRFYEKGTTAVMDDDLDSHVRWKNARYYNENSNVIRSSILIVQLNFDNGIEYANFHVGDLYRMYRKDGMKTVLPAIKSDIRSVKAMAGQNLALLNQFADYESIKDRIILRPLNLANSEKVLVKGIYRTVGDMALVLYLSLGDQKFAGANQIISTMVPREVFSAWNRDEDSIFSAALENTARLQPPVLYHSNDVKKSLNLQTPMIHFMEGDCPKIDLSATISPLLTTEQHVNGAIAVFYPGVLDRLYQIVGEEFYLSFISISEVYIHPVNGNMRLNTIRNGLRDVNKMNSTAELLTEKVYRYDSVKKELVEA